MTGKAYLDPSYVFVTLITGRPGSAMPPWTGRLPDDELWKIIAYLSSLGDQARAAGAK
jgi:mono/diheme cytochrome c family protein